MIHTDFINLLKFGHSIVAFFFINKEYVYESQSKLARCVTSGTIEYGGGSILIFDAGDGEAVNEIFWAEDERC
jgi:hypothetical protein